MDEKLTCCFCQIEMAHKWQTHNPDPVDKTAGHRCCEDCNTLVVLPARIGMIKRAIQLSKDAAK